MDMEVRGCRKLFEEVIDAGLCSYCGACAIRQQVFGAAYNVILIGALIGSGALPLDKKSLEPVLKENFPKEFDANMAAFNKGMKLAGH